MPRLLSRHECRLTRFIKCGYSTSLVAISLLSSNDFDGDSCFSSSSNCFRYLCIIRPPQRRMSANATVEGWVHQTNGRGTLDIIWTCTLTIFLCCWTSVCVNVPAITDTRWDQFRDKFNLACLAMLGPDFLCVLAVGQWESARRSVEVFRPKSSLNDG